MPRPIGSTTTPKYRRHRASGQAVVTLSGHDHYLGPWKSKGSHAEYDRLIAQWLAAGRQNPATANDLTVVELIARYHTFAERYYADPSGHTGQIDNLKQALRIVKRLYGHTPAIAFGPVALRTVRDAMIKTDWCRTHVNAQIGRVKKMIKWAVANEILPAGAHHALQAVDGLRFAKTEARETEPIKPVAAPFVDAVLPFLSAQVKSMVKLQSLTGMRSGELCAMRTCDIDTSTEIWAYRPVQHKTRHRGHLRIVRIGPRAQEIVKPLLKTDLSAFIFSPADAEAARRAALHATRKTPIGYGNGVGTNRKGTPKKSPGDRYTTHSYRRAVAMACRKAFPIPPEISIDLSSEEGRAKANAWRKQNTWHPHQLRHYHATEVRKQFGLEGVQAALGQKSVTAAQIYAEVSSEAAERVAAKVG